MENGLQRKIQNYLDSTGLSVAALERQAGLKTNTARNILRGQSKRPTAVTLQAIADVMDCTVQDLLGVRKEFHKTDGAMKFDDSPTIEDPELLKNVLDCILKISNDNNYQLSIHQTAIVLEEIYSYTIQKSPPNIDMVFVEWYLKRAFR